MQTSEALLFLSIAFLLLFPLSFAYSHEVYVLSPETIEQAMAQPPLQVFDIIFKNTGTFFFWMFIALWTVFTVASISVAKPVERLFDPLLQKLKPYAPLAARVTLGSAIIASGWFCAMFGPELEFTVFLSPALIPILQMLLVVLGVLILIGLFTRVAAVFLACLYLYMWTHYGTYMLTYTDYFGEALVALIVGNAALALDRSFHHLYPNMPHGLLVWFEKHAFLILRITFGISLIFASMYAKFLHAELALQVAIEYDLTRYFPFDPLFLVLGAFAIELLLGLFIMLGIEVRFASLFLGFFLTLSLLYFREAVWPHIILFGGAAAIFMHGYDRYTLELKFLRWRDKDAPEPVF